MPIPAEDRNVQLAVLDTILYHASHLLTEEELITEITAGITAFPERDPVQRAIRDLVANGVLHRIDGRFLQASRTARLVRELP